MRKLSLFCAGCGLATALFAGASLSWAQSDQDRPTLNKDKQQPAQPQAAPTISLDTPAAPPASSEEDAAARTLQAMPEGSATNLQAKLEATEAFLQKYPQSRYREILYDFLSFGYVQIGNAEKGIDFGEKAIEINANDVAAMAIVSQTIPRAINSNSADAAKKLDRAETLGRRAVEIVPTLPKPEGMSDEAFTSNKNQTLAMAHSGLGLVNWRRGKYADAIPELEQSVKMDTVPDPVNWLILGVANQNTSHFDAAAGAFTRCAAISGKLQDNCKARAEEAKKLAATKLSVPK